MIEGSDREIPRRKNRVSNQPPAARRAPTPWSVMLEALAWPIEAAALNSIVLRAFRCAELLIQGVALLAARRNDSRLAAGLACTVVGRFACGCPANRADARQKSHPSRRQSHSPSLAGSTRMYCVFGVNLRAVAMIAGNSSPAQRPEGNPCFLDRASPNS